MKHQINYSRKIEGYKNAHWATKLALLLFSRTHYYLDAAHDKSSPTYVYRYKVLFKKVYFLGLL